MAQTTCFMSFGPVLPDVTSCMSFHNSIIPIELVDVISIGKKTRLEKKRHILIAQTTRNTSFGLVLLIVA